MVSIKNKHNEMDSILQMAERLQDLCEQQRQLLEKMDARLRAESEKDIDELHNGMPDAERAHIRRVSEHDTP